ncbi:hypothetical protein EJ02DRAFT_213873 [Clathrospora elynae]|uniref:Uncharacterized protein n=1 Tax=Clathrospora elynae TaxID=706981 RepID=A0A6A5SMT4_9PLEO|nr:hypothetical protein EJ02DRAFT_213873 [Clathrospora elynae]
MPNDSKHLLPMSSILFKDRPSPSLSPSPRPPTDYNNPTLANLTEAQDTSITALPQQPAATDVQPPAESFWSRILAKIKGVLCFWREKRQLRAGESTGFRHVGTAKPLPLTRGVRAVDDEGEEDAAGSEWEDLE